MPARSLLLLLLVSQACVSDDTPTRIVVAGSSNGDASSPFSNDASSDSMPSPMLPEASMPPVDLTYAGHRYRIVCGEAITWSAAVDAAKVAGGYLACVSSKAEDDFVSAQVGARKECWAAEFGPYLGGVRIDATGSPPTPTQGWTWVDMSPWTDTHWIGSQPDNHENSEPYLDYYKVGNVVGWNDAPEQIPDPGKRVKGYVIEFDK